MRLGNNFYCFSYNVYVVRALSIYVTIYYRTPTMLGRHVCRLCSIYVHCKLDTLQVLLFSLHRSWIMYVRTLTHVWLRSRLPLLQLPPPSKICFANPIAVAAVSVPGKCMRICIDHDLIVEERLIER